MNTQQIRFDDGAAYERGMGGWSVPAGEIFLDWVKPPQALRWLDVGCGNGVFSELAMRRCQPTSMNGIDPSPAQISYAQSRPGAKGATFQLGDAMALPFGDDSFDIATMALVIFFVPDPAKGVAEMARSVRPGGIVAAYAWDILGGGFPFHPVQAAMRGMGMKTPFPPSVDAANIDRLQALWTGANLTAVETRTIDVTRIFPDFDSFWDVSTNSSALRPVLAAMDPSQLQQLRDATKANLTLAPDGSITYQARANAVKGTVKP
jgi:SAM-dependent methyltransferase